MTYQPPCTTTPATAAPFVEFMLSAIDEAICQAEERSWCDQVIRLPEVMDEGFATAFEIMARLGLAHRSTFWKNYLGPGLEMGLLSIRYPERAHHPRQGYRLTQKGLTLKKLLEKRE